MLVPWIKIEVILPDKEEVVTMAHLLKMKDADLVVGKLIRLWAWADQQTVDGNRVKVTGAFIDRLVFCKGFAHALKSVGWLEGEDGQLAFPHFERHNGETTKERIKTNRRVSKLRSKGEGVSPTGPGDARRNARGVSAVGQKGGFCNAGSVTNETARALPQPLPEEDIEFKNKEGGGGIPPWKGKKGAAGDFPPPPPPGLEGEDAPGLDGFIRWVQSLRPGWDVGELNCRERQAAYKVFKGLSRPVSDVEKTALLEYLRHEPERSSKFDYPPDRELFLAIFQEIVQKAMAWFRRTGRRTPGERQEARRKAATLKCKEREQALRRRAKTLRYEPDELIEELNALRLEHNEKALEHNELTKIRQGDYE